MTKQRTRYSNSHHEDVDVFLIGAGFSRALGAEMPLTRQLTKAVAEDLESRGLGEAFSGVPFFDSDFEKALTYLSESQPWLSEADRLRNRALFLDVADSIHRVLVNAQRDLLSKIPKCPGWFMRLVCWMHLNRSVVITLNYDTLIEMAAGEIMFGDGTCLHSQFLRPFGFPAREGVLYSSKPPTLQLLKLHGSLHWTYSGSEQFFGQNIQDQDLRRWSTAAYDERAFSLEDGRVPLVVPPTLNKNRYFENERVRSLWARAALALLHARQVFCIGYSLPLGDLLMRFLLHSTTRDDRRVPFCVVNCDGAARAHYTEALINTTYDLKDAYIRDREFDVLERFAEDLTHGEIETPFQSADVNRDFNELWTSVEKEVSEGLPAIDLVGQKSIIHRVDQYGILLEDYKDHGTRFWPWGAVTDVIEMAVSGKFDGHTGGSSHPLNRLTETLNRNQVNLLIVLFGAKVLEWSAENSHLHIRPCTTP